MISPPNPAALRSRLGRFAAISALVVWMAACSGVRVSSEFDSKLRLGPIQTFAWGDGASHSDALLDLEIRAAVAEELGRLGLEETALGEADLHVTYWTEVETKQRTNDPYFAHYPVVEYEIGRLTIGLMDPSTGAQLWHGTGSSELRTSAALIGLQATTLTPLDNEREWRVKAKVRAIIQKLRRDTDGRRPKDELDSQVILSGGEGVANPDAPAAMFLGCGVC